MATIPSPLGWICGCRRGNPADGTSFDRVAAVQLNFWINTRLASQFMEGSVTGIVLGFTLMLMPQAAIAQSIAIAALPFFRFKLPKTG